MSDLPSSERTSYIRQVQQDDRAIAFDLEEPCLLRMYVFKQTEEHYTVLKSEHHSISDGWSEPVLLNTVHDTYEALQASQSVKVRVDHSYLEAQEYLYKEKARMESYWLSKVGVLEESNDLRGLLSTTEDLDTVKSLPDGYDTRLEVVGEEYEMLKDLTQRRGLTLNTLVQFVWHKLIREYTGDRYTVVGTTVSGRDLPVSGIEDSVGLYINTLPLIIDWENDNTVLEQIEYLHQEITELNSHSFANLADLQKDGRRLFHSLFVFENYPMPRASAGDELVADFWYAVEKLDYPLGVTAYEEGDKLVLNLKSDRSLLTADQALLNLEKMKLLLSGLGDRLDKKHSVLSSMSSEEYDQQIYEWNSSERVYPKDRTIHSLFEAQVAKNPEATAVVFEGESLSYAELNMRANQVAHYLRSESGITSDSLIGICMDRSLSMLVGILGILKSGGAYVPIDPGYPAERIGYILSDTGTSLVLTEESQREFLSSLTSAKLLTLTGSSYGGFSTENLLVDTQAEDLAYVIYTSGTTGNPKGVMIEHTSVVSFAVDNNFIDYSRVNAVAGFFEFRLRWEYF